MMSFKSHEGFGQVAAATTTGAGSQAVSHGAAPAGAAPRPWWAGAQLLFGEPAPLSPEETRRDAQFQVVPGAQDTPDPAPAPPKRGTPEVLKFSVFQGDLLFIYFFILCCCWSSLWITPLTKENFFPFF
jgi:nuclear transcription factor Y alpha